MKSNRMPFSERLALIDRKTSASVKVPGLEELIKQDELKETLEEKQEKAARMTKRNADCALKIEICHEMQKAMTDNPVIINASTLFPKWREIPDRNGVLPAKVARFERETSFLLNVAWQHEQDSEMNTMVRRHNLCLKPGMEKFMDLFDDIREFRIPENQDNKEKEMATTSHAGVEAEASGENVQGEGSGQSSVDSGAAKQ